MAGMRIKPEQVRTDVAHASEDDEIDLLELVRALWRGKWTILLAAVLSLLIGGYYAFGVAESEYRSSAQLTLEARTNNVVDLESVVSGVSTEQAAMNTELEIILSRRLLGKVVDQLNLVDDPEFNPSLAPPSELAKLKGTLIAQVTSLLGSTESEEPATPAAEKSPRDRVIGNLSSSLSASVKRDTYVFNIGATTGNPEKSARIVNTLASIYLDDQIAVKFEATEQAVTWLSARVGELEEDLRAKEETLKNARSQTDLISTEALEGLNLQAKDLRDRLQEMRDQTAAAKTNETQLFNLVEAGDRAEAAAATGDSALQRLLQSIEDGDTDATDLFDQRLAALLKRAQADRERLQSQVAALAVSYQKLQDRIERQSEDLVRIQQLGREVETTRTLYETFLTRLKETTVQRGLQQADSRILSDAIAGAQVAPRTSRILALSFILGTLVGAALVLVRQFLHSDFRTAEDLEATTGLPVMGQIPKMPVKRTGLINYLRNKPTSAAAEAIRNLRTSILLSNIDAPPKVIMSTSSVPGEGKTTQAVALAQNLAGLGKKVLLMECDIRRRTFSQYFKTQPKGGILSALSGDVSLHEAVFLDKALGAHVLMGEKSSVNAADLFSSDRFRNFLDGARETYDYIIIDTPPVLVVPDARVIGQYVDAIVFSVGWSSTHRGQVTAALREFASVNLQVDALVLAQIDPKGMRRYGYGGKYGAYASYGKGYYEAG